MLKKKKVEINGKCLNIYLLKKFLTGVINSKNNFFFQIFGLSGYPDNKKEFKDD